MATIATDRNARRRSIAFGVLVVACLVLMAFSSNPLVRELQSGRYPSSEWVDKAPSLIADFFISDTKMAPESVDAMEKTFPADADGDGVLEAV